MIDKIQDSKFKIQDSTLNNAEGNTPLPPSQEGNKKKEKKTDFTNESQQNLMRIVECLATDVFRPMTTQEISDALGITKSKAYWTLQNLVGDGSRLGWVEQVADGWRLGPRMPKIAELVRKGIADNVKQYLEVK